MGKSLRLTPETRIGEGRTSRTGDPGIEEFQAEHFRECGATPGQPRVPAWRKTMTVLLGICAVVVTVAFVALVMSAIKALNRFGDTATQLEQTARRLDESIAGVQSVTREAHDLISSVGQVVPHVKRTVERLEGVG